MKNFCLIFLSFISCSLISQDLEKYKKQYPNDDIVRLQQETIITIKLNNGAFTIHKEVYEEDLYLNNSANYNSKRSISYSTFFNLDKIEASSFSKLDGKYVENKVVDFNEKNPKLTKGSKTSLKLTYDIKNPRFLSAFYFGDFYPIINNKVTIIADKNIQFTFKSFQLNNGTKITFKKKKKGTNYVYTWTTKNTKKFEIESNAPNYKTILPHIIPIITSYQQNGKTKKLLDGVEGLYSWYYSLVENINKEETDPALITLVEELTKGKESDIEKVKAIYYWTQQNIKYIAFEYALGGFIPREANEVFQKKYGDCKDNSSILYKMLEIAGLQGNLTWIGTRKIPYTYEEVPTPAVDNHMILTYENKNNTYYLDATGRYIQIEYPSSFIQGKEALIANGNNFKVKKIPVVPAHLNKVVDTTYIQISNRDIIGTSNSTFSGYIKNNLFYNLENTRKEADVKELYNPHFNKIVSSVKTKEDRKYGIEFDYKRQFSYTNIIEIPDGYEVSYLPTSVSYSNDLISIDLSYSTDKNKIVCKQDVVFNFIKLNKEQQQKVNTFVEKTEKASKEIIILKKK